MFTQLRRRVKLLLVTAGIDFYLKTEDREILEDTILPAIASSQHYQHILFIGCDWYTRGYKKLFADRDYWTLEIDPAKRKYGARQHIVDTAENLTRHFKPGSLDFILCNGVIGWGLNKREGIESMLEASWDCLRERGVLLIGWNNVPERLPVVLSELKALRRFKPYVLPQLGVAELTTNTDLRHTYSLFTKPCRA